MGWNFHFQLAKYARYIFVSSLFHLFCNKWTIQIGPNHEPFPFWIHNPCSGQRPIYKLLVSRVCWKKSNLLFHILYYDLSFLRIFLLHWCVQFSHNTHLGAGHFTGWCLQMLRQTGTHFLQVWSTNLCSWLIDRTSLSQIVYVQNELIFSVFVLFCLNVFRNIWCHSIAQFTWFELMPFHCSNLWIWNTFIFCCHSILSLSLQPVCVCVQINLRRYDMQSFSAKVGSRGCHVYCGNNWTNLVILPLVQISIKTNAISKVYDPYCCKITITQRDKIGAVTVGHIPRELSRFVNYFLQEGGSVTSTVASIQYRVSPLPEWGLEITIQMTFSHTSKRIVEKMKLFVES